MHDCPNDETLAAFIDGHLEGAARDAVIEHLVTCDECRSICQGAWEYQASQPAEGGKILRPHFRDWRPYAAAAAAAVMVLVVGGVVAEPKIQERRDAKRAIATVNKTRERPIDGRLFGENAYREYPDATRGVDTDDPDKPIPPPDPAQMELLGIADDLDIEHHRTARNLHTLGIAQLELATGEHRREYLDDAIANLDEAASKAPDDVPLLNDRAAAYAARGNYNRPADVEKAIDLAERAWKLEHTPEIAWNRAIALQLRPKGTAAAIAAWDDYLKLDSSSGWAKKAKEKRNTLANPY
jgi:tetratricopeptide (TPR) repeat protein